MWIRTKKKVMLPVDHLPWLSLSYREVAMELKKAGIRPLTLPISINQIDNANPVQIKISEKIPEDAAYYAVAVEAEVSSFDTKKEHTERLEHWRRKLSMMICEIEKALARNSINLMVVVQGYEPLNAVARFVAIKQNIPVLSIENTALASCMLWDNISGITTNKNLARNYFWKYHGVFQDAAISEFKNTFQRNLRQAKSVEHTSPIGVLFSGSHRPIVLFLGQVLTDSSIIFGTGKWGSPLKLIESLCYWCNKNNHQLIIKLHPKESIGKNTINNSPYNKLTYRKIQQSEDLINLLIKNEAVIDANNDYDTYALIKNACFAVTVNSQAGLEASLLGTPVVVAGEAFYSGLGFTIDAPEPRSVNDQFNEATNWSVPKSAAEFSYIFFEHYCKPKTATSLAKLIVENVSN